MHALPLSDEHACAVGGGDDVVFGGDADGAVNRGDEAEGLFDDVVQVREGHYRVLFGLGPFGGSGVGDGGFECGAEFGLDVEVLGEVVECP